MRVLTKEEIGERVADVVALSGVSKTKLCAHYGWQIGYLGELERGERTYVDCIRLKHVAAYCAGQGRLRNYSDGDLFSYMHGDLEQLVIGQLRAVPEPMPDPDAPATAGEPTGSSGRTT